MVSTIGQVIAEWNSFWQLVHNHVLWDLEWFDPSNNMWASVKSDLSINKAYPAEDTCKVTLIFNASQTGNYRLTLSTDTQLKDYITKLDKYQYILNYDDYGLVFDWSDIAAISGLQITHGIKTVDNAKYFWFRINRNNIPKGTQIRLDPTLVGTSTSTTPVIQPHQKKCFYANGRWWIFYYDGSNFGWKTSTDGSSWSSFTTYGAYPAQRFDLWYDEANNKICLVRGQGGTAGLYYRQGTANSDGTISWDSTEVTINSSAKAYEVKVCKDSNGYPWVSYLNAVAYTEEVCKASTTSGSAWGSPTTLWTNRGGGNEKVILVPLTGGKMLAISTVANDIVKSRLYTGSSWDNEVSASSSYPDYYAHADAVADGDNAHLVFVKTGAYDIIYIKYTYGSGWGSEETVESGTVSQYHPTVSLKSTDKVRIFYLLSQTTIKYRDRDNGSWQTAVTISSSESTMTCICSSYQTFSSKICVTWKSGASSPYNVNFEGYTLATVKEVADSLSLSDSILRNKMLLVSDSVGLADVSLSDKTFAVTDFVCFSEVIEVLAGAIVKYVADAIGLSEQIKLDKNFIVSDAMNLFDQVFRHKPSVAIVDAMELSDNAYVSKILFVSDQIALAEIVEKSVWGGVKTRVFLVFGDLAVQICGG